MFFISFSLFIFVVYFQYCPTTNKQLKCQIFKCFIYYHFIYHNTQSNTLAKTIHKSQLTSHFLNSDSPTHQSQKKKSLRQTETPRPQTQSHIQIQFTIILCQKKKNNTISQSQIHNTNIISMLCQVPEALRQCQRRGTVAAEARRRDGGLWRRRAMLTVCAAPWLTADSSQYSVLSLNLSTPITLSRSLTLSTFSLSLFFFNLNRFLGLKVLMGF